MISAYAGIINKVLDMLVPFFKPTAILARKRRKVIIIADRFVDAFEHWTDAKNDVIRRRAITRMLHYYHCYKKVRQEIN